MVEKEWMCEATTRQGIICDSITTSWIKGFCKSLFTLFDALKIKRKIDVKFIPVLKYIKLYPAFPKFKFFVDQDFCLHFSLGFLSSLKRQEHWEAILVIFPIVL